MLIIRDIILSKRQSMQREQVCMTFKSAPNIALVKYWGKFDQSEIIPINDSIGLTLNTHDLHTTTTCSFAKAAGADSFVLNAKQAKITSRMAKVLARVRQRVRSLEAYQNLSEAQWSQFHFRIVSQNSFPSASGMASSASGYSCLVACLNHLFGGIFSQQELSLLARSGSGSAARSLFGGLVFWRGVEQKYLNQARKLQPQQLQAISRSSISYSVQQSKNLDFIKIIALVTENKEKEISSTIGMKNSWQTSSFIKLRNGIAKQRIQQVNFCLDSIIQARKCKDKQKEYSFYSQFAEVVIKDSNSFHAVCLDTYPPIFYMNQFSKQIVKMVDHIINKESKMAKVAYTFDAGPHGFLFVHEDMLSSVVGYLYAQFNGTLQILNDKGKKIIENIGVEEIGFTAFQQPKIAPKGIWVTDVGRGPEQCQTPLNTDKQ